ncbi:MAG: YerC/YecD family TrpR-related protein [Oscillospiraceae bacterium]|nr:YerC/YecD family TrpR-related protein [Oscillospiraceae bacterium]
MYEKYRDIQLDELFDAILSLKTREECYKFLDDLCTVQELKALTQRLLVAKMLDRQCVYNEIVAQTGASTATISRVNRSLHYGSGGYRVLFDRLRENTR